MRSEPSIAAAAALIGNPGRAAMLGMLMDGRALPASELATAAGLSAAGASDHLAQLLSGGLLTVIREGRHRYYRLANENVAAVLEGLATLGDPRLAPRTISKHQNDNPLRLARTCYDHLAGELGVLLASALQDRTLLVPGEGKRFSVTPAGAQWFADKLSIEIDALKPARHGIAYGCLDWTERRYHLAGPLGAVLLRRRSRISASRQRASGSEVDRHRCKISGGRTERELLLGNPPPPSVHSLLSTKNVFCTELTKIRRVHK